MKKILLDSIYQISMALIVKPAYAEMENIKGLKQRVVNSYVFILTYIVHNILVTQ